eukprot:1985872-Amphidinium_carterae.1
MDAAVIARLELFFVTRVARRPCLCFRLALVQAQKVEHCRSLSSDTSCGPKLSSAGQLQSEFVDGDIEV